MLETPTLSLIERALDYSSTRQEALADNIANIDTPGYQRKDASFESVLAAANDADSAGTALTGQTNDPRDFPIGPSSAGPVQIETDAAGPMRVDGNNVDMDAEMAKLAQNQIYYQTLTELAGRQFSDLKYVIEH